MRNSKCLVSNMSELRVLCSYDELLRFKKSAAMAAAMHYKEYQTVILVLTPVLSKS